MTDPITAHPLRANARILSASLVGTAVEFYDFYIYATAAALVFGPLFFPQGSPAAQTLYAFMTFGIAFVARPVGAVAFGHFGDRIGRKSTLVASLLLMGTSTVLIGFLPTYAMTQGLGAGWLAPLLLCVMRFGQGFGLGGEWGGAALLAVENAPPGWEARFGAAPQLGAPLGFLAANGLFLLLGLTLTEADFAAWGWRIPFIASGVLVVIGLRVRLRVGETAAFREALAQASPPAVPVVRLMRDHAGAVLTGSAAVIACFAIFYLSTAYALALGTKTLGYPRETFLTVQLAANCLLACGIVAAAVHADRAGASATLRIGAAATVLLGLLFAPGLAAGSLWLVFGTLATALFIMGYVYGPLGGWLPTLFPVSVRYTGISVAFNAGGIIGGAVTPILAQLLSDAGRGSAVGLLLSAAAIVTLAGVSLAKVSPTPAAAA